MKTLSILLIFLFFLSPFSYSQTIKTIPGDYPTIAAAVDAVNAGPLGNIVFNVAAGHVETSTGVISLNNFSGIGYASVTFQKSGVGPNPLIIAYTGGTGTPASAVPDGIFRLWGRGGVTIDGIDLMENPANTTSPATMEYGYGIFKANGVNGGVRFCVIKNCTITLNRNNNQAGSGPMLTGSVGIYMGNCTATAATTAIATSAVAGCNNSNLFLNNTIQNCNIAIGISGYQVGPNVGTNKGDADNEIRGNTITNFGGAIGASNPAAGIWTLNQYPIKIDSNIVDNNNGSGINHTAALYGIYHEIGAGSSSYGGGTNLIFDNSISLKLPANNIVATGIAAVTPQWVAINRNNIHDGNCSAGSSASFIGISSDAKGYSSNITNNIIQNNNYQGFTAGNFTAVNISVSCPPFNVSVQGYNIKNNQVVNNSIGTPGAGNTCIFKGINSTGYCNDKPSIDSNLVSGNSINSGSGQIYCLSGFNTAFKLNANQITNNGISNASSGTSCQVNGVFNSSSSGYNATNNYINNNINNLFIGGASTSASNLINGIYEASLVTGDTMRGNNINNLQFTSSTGNATIAGIRTTVCKAPVIYRNVIHSLSAAGTNSVVAGIYAGAPLGSSAYVYNNLIGNLSTPASTGSNLFGIYAENGSTNLYFYFNSVYLNSTSTGTGFGSAAFYISSTIVPVTLRNNILVNLSTATGTGVSSGILNISSSTSNYDASSNNNLVYAGVPGPGNAIYSDGSGAYQTLPAAKTRLSPAETNSITETVSSTAGVFFQSLTGPAVNTATNFLHIVNGLATGLESGGTAVSGISTDYDADNRFSVPDIGADEFAGSAPDIIAPAITYSALPNTCNTGTVSLVATITDASGVPTSGVGLPVLYWKVNSAPYNAVTAVHLGTDQYKFDFGGGSNSDTITYYIAAQDNNSTPNVSISAVAAPGGYLANPPRAVNPPTSAGYYLIKPPMSGTFSIGSGGNYPSVTAAINAYNTNCVSGAVVFQLIDANYPSETFPIIVNSDNGPSGSYSLTIKPAAGVQATIVGNTADFLLRIYRNNVIIDGSNTAGGTTRDLTIKNTATSSPGTILFGSSGTTYISDLELRNITLINGINSSSSFVVGGSTSTPVSEYPGYFKNVVIENISSQKTKHGIYLRAITAAGNGAGTVISKNDLSAPGVNAIGSAGITMEGTNGSLIVNNNIGNFETTATTQTGILLGDVTNCTISGNHINNLGYSGTAASNAVGIEVGTNISVSNVNVIGNSISGISSGGTNSAWSTSGIIVRNSAGGVTIQNNKIFNIKNSNINGYGASGIQISSSNTSNATAANIVVKNNMISDVSSYGGTGNLENDNGYGILITKGFGLKIYNNSVDMATDQTSGASTTAALNVTSNQIAVDAIDLRNNIFSNRQTVGAQRYAIICTHPSAFNNVDYNDYYSTGPNLASVDFNDQPTLASIQSSLGGNANSKNIQPFFTSLSDLHLDSTANLSLDNLGTPIAGVTRDIDGQLKNLATPDMGADEFGSGIGGRLYLFNGRGFWSDPANWFNNMVPPSTLPANDEVEINGFGNCILDTPFILGTGSILTIRGSLLRL